MLLTIGMPTYRDHHWMVATLQALRMYQDLDDCELLVVDNYGTPSDRAFCSSLGVRYVLDKQGSGTAYAKQRVFDNAKGDYVLCMDSHIFLWLDAILRLKEHLRELPPDNKDLMQGPMWYDPLTGGPSMFKDVWSGGMHGQWQPDPRGDGLLNPPFEIWAQGTGVMCCRKEAWPGFHLNIRGFFAEAVYIHDKVRKAGGKCWCLPFLRWWHYFRPEGERPPYRLTDLDKFRNYLIGYKELGQDPTRVINHFLSLGINPSMMQYVVQEVYGDEKDTDAHDSPADIGHGEEPGPAGSTRIHAGREVRPRG